MKVAADDYPQIAVTVLREQGDKDSFSIL